MPNTIPGQKVKMHLIRYVRPEHDGMDVGLDGDEDVVFIPKIYEHISVKIRGESVIVHDNGKVLSGTANELGIHGKHESEFCSFCGTQFEKKNYRQKYCSHACKTYAQRIPPP